MVPLVMAMYLFQKYTGRSYEKLYKIFTLGSLALIPVYSLFVVTGYQPITWIVNPTWNSSWSTMQYVVYIGLTGIILYWKTSNYVYSYTLSIISATTAGYLYEVPLWLERGGVLELFRTAKNSFIVLDFGMLAVGFMFYMVLEEPPRLDRALFFSLLVYVVYCVIHLQYFPQPFKQLHKITKLPMSVLLRFPSLFLTYQFAKTTQVKTVTHPEIVEYTPVLTQDQQTPITPHASQAQDTET